MTAEVSAPSHPYRTVTSESGVRYRLVRLLGRGGQGEVWEIQGGKLAAKLLREVSGRQRDLLRNQLSWIRRTDLGVADVVTPREILQPPSLGYVMDLVTGMQPLDTLARPPAGVNSTLEWYLSGGGLKQRLRLLARVADALSEVHSKGLAYGDPSPGNVFVSESPDDNEVRLIDADNIRVASSPAHHDYFTPGFGAPEVVLGRSGASTLADAHAFAVIAFLVLVGTHPLLGDHVSRGEPELENSAFEGRLPWVDHSVDTSNRTCAGLPRSEVLSPRLLQLAVRAFEDGLLDPLKRPSVSEWGERLHAAARAVVTCPTCRWSYYGLSSARPACPRCGAKAPSRLEARLALRRRSASAGKTEPDVRLNQGAVVTDGDPLEVTRRLVLGTPGKAGQQLLAQVKKAGGAVLVEAWTAGVTVREPGAKPASALAARIPRQFEVSNAGIELIFSSSEWPEDAVLQLRVPVVK